MSIALTKTRDLDRAVADVRQLVGEAFGSYWRLGAKLREIHTAQLWKLRIGEDGRNRYSGFETFVRAELQMSTSHARSLIEVATSYTEDQARELGPAKATLLLRAPESERPRLAAKAKAGATYRAIAKDVSAAREAKGSPKKGQHANAGRKSAAARAEKRTEQAATSTPAPAPAKAAAKGGKIIARFPQGPHRITLHVKPASLRGVVINELPRATNVDDAPIGRLVLANGVALYVMLGAKDDGALYLKIEARDETPEAGGGEPIPQPARKAS